VVDFLEERLLRARGMLITASLVEHGRGRGEICTFALLTTGRKAAFQGRRTRESRLVNRAERPSESI
jgi:hypothetical protein